ncbi:MAG: glycosyltransferase family 2 protein [Chloroflexota bacterium]|nr:glycosyltransferase family 2 protein [Chloroflexota bacterium]
MIHILYITILSFLIIVLINSVINFIYWKNKKDNSEIKEGLSILIPARNEEDSIEKCINSIYFDKNFIKEVLVFNDSSTDSTKNILEGLSKKYTKLKVINGTERPKGWSGKSFACFQLSKYAKSNLILFIDADTELNKDGIDSLVNFIINNKYTMVSAWPKIETKTIIEKILMPLLNFIVFTSFPTFLSKNSNRYSLGLAHGACIIFYKKTYDKLTGHNLVKNSLFEDTDLAKKWRENGELSYCINGMNIIKVRMYDNFSKIWTGFEKNTYPAFKNNFYFFTFHLLNLLIFNLPVIAVPLYLLGIINNLIILICGIIIIFIRLIFSLKFKHPWWSFLFHSFAETIFFFISISSFLKYNFMGGIEWKDRKYGKQIK